MKALSKAMSFACYVHDADFRDPEALHDAVAEEKLSELMYVLLCNTPYSLRRQINLKDTRHNMFEPNDMNDYCDLSENLIIPLGHNYLFLSALYFSSEWRRLQPLRGKKKVSNDGEC